MPDPTPPSAEALEAARRFAEDWDRPNVPALVELLGTFAAQAVAAAETRLAAQAEVIDRARTVAFGKPGAMAPLVHHVDELKATLRHLDTTAPPIEPEGTP